LKYNHEEKLTLAVQKLHHYILLCTTKVMEDSNLMQYLLSRRKINGKFSRWIVILQEYDLEFSTPKRNKELVLSELIMMVPSDTTNSLVNTDFPDEHLVGPRPSFEELWHVGPRPSLEEIFFRV
jgi:hypothetical protein